MIKIIGTLTIFGGLAFLGLGFIFLVAGGTDNVWVGSICVMLGLVLFLVTYGLMRLESKRPTVVNQEFNVQMSGSGEFQEREMQCPACGAPVEGKDIKLIEGGLMISCPFCQKVTTLEEAPKW